MWSHLGSLRLELNPREKTLPIYQVIVPDAIYQVIVLDITVVYDLSTPGWRGDNSWFLLSLCNAINNNTSDIYFIASMNLNTIEGKPHLHPHSSFYDQDSFRLGQDLSVIVMTN